MLDTSLLSSVARQLMSADEPVARPAAFAARGFSRHDITNRCSVMPCPNCGILFLSDRYFFITVRLLPRRTKLMEDDFKLLARAFNRARPLHRFYLTAWVFLSDYWHCIVAPRYPETTSGVIKSVKLSSMTGINQYCGAEGELWQPRFFDRVLGTVKEYHEKVEYIRLHPVRAALVGHSQDWRWSSFNEYAGIRPEEQQQRCGLTIDRVRIHADSRTRL